jgi:hypothetical protein
VADGVAVGERSVLRCPPAAAAQCRSPGRPFRAYISAVRRIPGSLDHACGLEPLIHRKTVSARPLAQTGFQDLQHQAAD